jgi:nucleoside-diphosphate-sugar epimerase
LKKAFGEHFDQLELVEADLLDDASISKAVEGAHCVVHTASPFSLIPPKNKDDMIKPAVEGTLSVCRAAAKNHIKRVVITSSCVAIMNRKDKANGKKFTRDDWSEIDQCDAYSESKTLAEKAAWDF